MRYFRFCKQIISFAASLGLFVTCIASVSDAEQTDTSENTAATEELNETVIEQPDETVVESRENSTKDLGRPTHKQVSTIQVNTNDLSETSLTSFCLAANGNILAACQGEVGEIREFTTAGEFVKTWDLPFKPEAINVGSDGNIFVAGTGKLLKLSPEGESLLEAEAPHVVAIASDPEKIREEIIEQSKQMREQFDSQLKTYNEMLAPLKEKAKEERTDEDERQIAMFEQVIKQYKDMSERYGATELTEEQLDEKVAASIEYKSRVASISEADGAVFIATGSMEGYGYDVWKMDEDFGDEEVIITGLRGCCGQMDVQCCQNGIYVAENSRHRVSRYDLVGEMVTSWGKQAREGLDGFGSCCNPMNVAFGDDGSVYTAESTTGRIKQFTPDGELIALIGKVDIVPGCKKVAIAVAKDGGNVFMLDITRNEIQVMDRLKPGETIAYRETESGNSLVDAVKGVFGF